MAKGVKQLHTDKDWWRGAVIYQIYPRSFQDSNDDGIGDLRGIITRLDYIADLGVDAIWISPFFVSPMQDFGYDVSDYCDIDPMFGNLADFDTLVMEAHTRGIAVMIDLVLSHTSDQHPWFAESRQSKGNPKSDWYVWSDPLPDGTAPNNWLSIFGGSAWQWDGRRQQYYLHNFLKSQPDLNFHTPAVQKALLDVTRFWLERGVDGFRLDTINFYMHDAQFRSNPPLPFEKRNDSIAPQVNPYNHQQHIYDRNHPDNILFLQKFRYLLDEYGATTAVGEIGDAQNGLKIMGEYTAGDDKMHMCYAFEFLTPHTLTPARIVSVFDQIQRLVRDGWPCWAFSNHDVERHASRWHLSPAAKRLYIKLLLAMRGSVCIYQGEELGLGEADVPFEALKDPYGIEFWPEFKGRDGCRTPMVWDGAQKNAAFSNATPWLPVDTAHIEQSVAHQKDDPSSILNFYRAALQQRKKHPVLAKGDMLSISAQGALLRFERKDAQTHLLCLFNMSDAPIKVTLAHEAWAELHNAGGGAVSELDLPAWGAHMLCAVS